MFYRYYKNLDTPQILLGEWFESDNIPEVTGDWEGVWTKAQENSWITSKEVQPLPETFAEYSTLEMFIRSMDELHIVNNKVFLKWRNALKAFVVSLGADEASGFEAITPGVPSSAQKAFVSCYNIGTAVQRLLAIPNSLERDAVCYEYININEGLAVGAKSDAANLIKGVVFSRCDHIIIQGLSMPSWIRTQIEITAAALPFEFPGSLLERFALEGVKGYAAGGSPLGLSDFLKETGVVIPGVYTGRFAVANGGGLRTNAVLLAALADTVANPIGIDGFATPAEFADFLYDILITG